MNQRDTTVRKNLMSQASEMDGKAKSTGMQAIARDCEKARKWILPSPRLPRRSARLWTPCPVRLISDF